MPRTNHTITLDNEQVEVLHRNIVQDIRLVRDERRNADNIGYIDHLCREEINLLAILEKIKKVRRED